MEKLNDLNENKNCWSFHDSLNIHIFQGERKGERARIEIIDKDYFLITSRLAPDIITGERFSGSLDDAKERGLYLLHRLKCVFDAD